MAMESERNFKNSGDDPLPPHKDQIDQWIKDGVDLVSLIDQGDVRDVDAVKQYLTCAGDLGCFGKANIFGQTALLVACRNGQLDIVNFLLESGADANVTCNVGNSALHYACQANEDVVSICREKPAYPKEKLVEIIKIVELLVHHGATLQMNDDGLSPACVAALNSFKDVVASFASSSVITMPLADKVKAYKLLGVSQAIFDEYHVIDACESFHMAASLQSKDDDHISSEFDAFFVEMMNKEDAGENEKFKIQLKAYIIGLQYVPPTIRNKHDFIDDMSEFAADALFEGKSLEEGYDMLVALIQKEMQEENLLGTVMEVIKTSTSVPFHEITDSLRFIPKLLEVYAEALRAYIYDSHSRGKLCEILENMGHLLFNLAYYLSKSKYLLHSLPFVGSIVACIKKVVPDEISTGADQQNLSITGFFFESMADAMWEDVYSWQSKKARNRLKLAICRLLYYNGFDPDSDKSLLQTLLDVAPVARDMDFIVSISRVLIRYGSRTDDAFLGDVVDEDPELSELLEPTMPVTLEELASRTILRNYIPYRERLPDILCEKIEGEKLLTDPSELDSSTESDSD